MAGNLSVAFLVEESTCMQLATNVKKLLERLPTNATPIDHLIGLSLILLSESDYCLTSTRDVKWSKKDIIYNFDNWKSKETQAYTIKLFSQRFFELECTLVAIPCGDIVILNFFPNCPWKSAYAMTLQVLKYVNPFSTDPNCRFMNLKELSYRFKNTLITPVHLDIATKMELTGPGLSQLPNELKLKIIKMLKPNDVRRLSCCSRIFYQLCGNPKFKK